MTEPRTFALDETASQLSAAYTAASAAASPSAPPELAVAVFAAAAAQAKLNLQAARNSSAAVASHPTVDLAPSRAQIWTRFKQAITRLVSTPTLRYGLPAMAVAVVGFKVATVDAPPHLMNEAAMQGDVLSSAGSTNTPSKIAAAPLPHTDYAAALPKHPAAAQAETPLARKKASKEAVSPAQPEIDRAAKQPPALPTVPAMTSVLSAAAELTPPPADGLQARAAPPKSAGMERATATPIVVMPMAAMPSTTARMSSPAPAMAAPKIPAEPLAAKTLQAARLSQPLLALIIDAQGNCQTPPTAAAVRNLLAQSAPVERPIALKHAEQCGFTYLLPTLSAP